MDLRCIVLSGRSQMHKGHDLLYDSIYVILLKRKNYRNRKKKIKEKSKEDPLGLKGKVVAKGAFGGGFGGDGRVLCLNGDGSH